MNRKLRYIFRAGTFFFFVAAMLGIFALVSDVGAAPETGEYFPDISFDKPKDSQMREYLGLWMWGNFTIADIESEAIIIELFSMYCPHCQAEAPLTKEMYRMIESDPRYSDKLKFIGIGIKNSEFEVDYFAEKYDIPFPLIADEKDMVQQETGKVYTPHYVVVKITEDKRAKIIFSQMGRIDDAAEFLEMVYELVMEEW
jgi:peroxiredoxin